MIAKIIVWDTDRPRALRRLRGALAATEVAGLNTNLSFLAAVAAHPAFADAAVDTGFIETHAADLIPAPRPAPPTVLALAALAELLRIGADAAALAAATQDPHSPWHARDGWRLAGRGETEIAFTDDALKDGAAIIIRARPEAGGYRITLPGGTVFARGSLEEDGAMAADIDGARLHVVVLRDGDALQLIQAGTSHRLRRAVTMAASPRSRGGHLTAPMPGRIVAVHVAIGESVRTGQALIVLEAMKMEHIITAPADGTVAAIHHPAGDQVAEGAELLSLAAR
jgi:3-methylcrotonyl-CoA carboxylase alpha subunit